MSAKGGNYKEQDVGTPEAVLPWSQNLIEKKKKKLHHSSHIRLIRWTLPVSRDIGEHNEQAESTSVYSIAW